jgi:hypothetical protein
MNNDKKDIEYGHVTWSSWSTVELGTKQARWGIRRIRGKSHIYINGSAIGLKGRFGQRDLQRKDPGCGGERRKVYSGVGSGQAEMSDSMVLV